MEYYLLPYFFQHSGTVKTRTYPDGSRSYGNCRPIGSKSSRHKAGGDRCPDRRSSSTLCAEGARLGVFPETALTTPFFPRHKPEDVPSSAKHFEDRDTLLTSSRSRPIVDIAKKLGPDVYVYYSARRGSIIAKYRQICIRNLPLSKYSPLIDTDSNTMNDIHGLNPFSRIPTARGPVLRVEAKSCQLIQKLPCPDSGLLRQHPCHVRNFETAKGCHF